MSSLDLGTRSGRYPDTRAGLESELRAWRDKGVFWEDGVDFVPGHDVDDGSGVEEAEDGSLGDGESAVAFWKEGWEADETCSDFRGQSEIRIMGSSITYWMGIWFVEMTLILVSYVLPSLPRRYVSV